MKKIISLLLIILIFLCSCAAEDRDFSSVTEVSEESKVFVPYPDDLELKEEESFVYTPDASEKLKAVWISQYDITKAMCSKEGQNPAGDYAAYIDNMCKELKNKGYNALFVQVRPFGDSFYPSGYYPPSQYAVGGFRCPHIRVRVSRLGKTFSSYGRKRAFFDSRRFAYPSASFLG